MDEIIRIVEQIRRLICTRDNKEYLFLSSQECNDYNLIIFVCIRLADILYFVFINIYFLLNSTI